MPPVSVSGLVRACPEIADRAAGSTKTRSGTAATTVAGLETLLKEGQGLLEAWIPTGDRLLDREPVVGDMISTFEQLKRPASREDGRVL